MSKEEILNRLQAIFQNVFDEDVSINEETKPSDIDGWDSLTQIVLLSAIQNNFGIDISMDEAITIDGVASIVKIIEAKKKKL